MEKREIEKIIEKGVEEAENLVIRINNQVAEVRVAGRKESIIEYAIFIRDPENTCAVYDGDNFYFAGDYDFEKEDWKAFVRFSQLGYKISRKSPYESQYSVFVYIKSVSSIIALVLASPTLWEVPLSGLFVEIGIPGINYNRTAEIASAFIQMISDKPTLEIINKERENKRFQQDIDATDIIDEETENFDDFMFEDFGYNENDYETEEYDYE